MKLHYLILLLFVISSCSNNQKEKEIVQKEIAPKIPERILRYKFKMILDSAKVEGSILVYDLQNEIYYSNDFDWAEKGFLPASTFKIPNSIIALETGVVEDAGTLFPWDGKKRNLKSWEQDLIFKDAFRFSCVPCYQEIARNIGSTRMKDYLNKLNYGNMMVDSTNIDLFWLEGESKISQFEQIDFLKRFYNEELHLSEKTTSIMKSLMLIEKDSNYTLSGKTGWSTRDGNNNGWFVGYVENMEGVYFFATNITPEESFNMDLFPKIRVDISSNALKELRIIN